MCLLCRYRSRDHVRDDRFLRKLLHLYRVSTPPTRTRLRLVHPFNNVGNWSPYCKHVQVRGLGGVFGHSPTVSKGSILSS